VPKFLERVTELWSEHRIRRAIGGLGRSLATRLAPGADNHSADPSTSRRPGRYGHCPLSPLSTYHPDSQPLKRLNSVEHGSDCLTCGEPARADYRRDQHTDSRNFNDTHQDFEICRRQPLASRTRPAELNRPRSCSALESLSSSNLLKTSESALTTPSGRRGGDTMGWRLAAWPTFGEGLGLSPTPHILRKHDTTHLQKTKRAPEGAPVPQLARLR
jgi:hypothetical protein